MTRQPCPPATRSVAVARLFEGIAWPPAPLERRRIHVRHSADTIGTRFGAFLHAVSRRSSTLISPRCWASRRAFFTVLLQTPALAAMCSSVKVQAPLRWTSTATTLSTACSARVNMLARRGGRRPEAAQERRRVIKAGVGREPTRRLTGLVEGGGTALRASISTESSDASSSVTLPAAKAFQSADDNFGNSTRGDASTARVSAQGHGGGIRARARPGIQGPLTERMRNTNRPSRPWSMECRPTSRRSHPFLARSRSCFRTSFRGLSIGRR